MKVGDSILGMALFSLFSRETPASLNSLDLTKKVLLLIREHGGGELVTGYHTPSKTHASTEASGIRQIR